MAVRLRDFIDSIEEDIPLSFQEGYDNSGLQAGDPETEINSALLTLDITEEVIREAYSNGHNLVVSHHPLIFNSLKSVSPNTHEGRCIISALKNGIALYSAHTNLDNLGKGVSNILAEKLGLKDIHVLAPVKGALSKLVTYVPVAHAERVREALFASGAGHTGNYDSCSFGCEGTGSFRPGQETNPFTGEKGKMHYEPETRIETVVLSHLLDRAVEAMLKVHPYEEVAYDIIPLGNIYHGAGAGAAGTLPEPLTGNELLARIKTVCGTQCLRYSGDISQMVTKVAVCGGAGSSLLPDAARCGAQAFITSDIKYHAFTSVPAKMMVVDAGHYETEKFALDLLSDLIIKKFPNFALRFSDTKTNPINYF